VSTVVWTIVLAVVALLGALVALLGPRLYREGRSFAAPIAELAGAEQAVAAVNRELPFEPPRDGLVQEGRLLVFLDVWEELRPRYQRWHELVEEGRHGQAKSWQDAKAALAATRDVQHAQIEILRSHRLSPAELVWLDDMVLSKWWRRIEPLLSGPDRPAVVEKLQKTGEDDLLFVAELERQHGRSPATRAMKQRLEERLASLEPSTMPRLPDLPVANQQLFWRHRQRIAAIGAPSSYPLHGLLGGRGGVSINSGHP
jgi:hypothetical protein